MNTVASCGKSTKTNPMKKLHSLYLLFFCLFIWYAVSSNPPNGRSGAPGDDNCTSCHTPGESNFEGEVNIDGFPDDILPNTTYNLVITTNFSSGNPSRAGFQMLVLDGSNNNIGTFSNLGTSTEVEAMNGREYLEHRPAKSFNGSNEVSWTADWTSPSSAINNEIKVYINSIIGNGSGSSGDLMVSTQPIFNLMEEVVLPPLGVQISNQQDVSCFNGTDGQATVTANGGDNNYSYQWSNGMDQATASNLRAGNYQVTITDGVGSIATTMVTINQPSELVLSISNIMNKNCTSDTGSAMAQAIGGTIPYSFNWSNNSMAQAVSLSEGMHSVTVTDVNGCSKSMQISISDEQQIPVITAGEDLVVDCSAENRTSVQLEGIVSSIGENITYSWTTTDGNIQSGENTLTPIVNASGTYTLNVLDESNGCSNIDDVSVTFTTITNCDSGTISGKIISANGEPLNNITVNINEQSVITSSDGSYRINEIPFQSNPVISPIKLDGITEMVSTFDIVLITQHILSSVLLESPLHLIAADANNSGTITAFDIVQIRKVILGIDNEFLNNTSWKFIPVDFDLSSMTNLSDIPTNITINNFTSDQFNQDFIAIKIGDVSFDISNGFNLSEKRAKQALLMEIPSNPFEAGSTVELPIHFPNLEEFIGFQLELNFDPSLLQFKELNYSNFFKLNGDNISYQYLREGKILISWENIDQFTDRETNSINLAFLSKKMGNIEDAIWLDNQYLTTEAYTQDLQIKEVFISPRISRNNTASIQVYPNPASNFLRVNIPKNHSAIREVTLYNHLGLKMKSILSPKIEENTYSISLDDIATGTYFVVFTSDEDKLTKRVLIVK